MVRTQVQLTEEQSRQLKALAAEKGVSIAELIRQAVDSLLDKKYQPDAEEIKRRALSVVGAFRSGVSDVSIRHDDYLDEAYGQ